jgi:iron complex outermembrane recepter protein
MPPMRVGGGAYWRNDNWFVRMGLLHAFAQTDIAQFETPTDGYNLLRAEIVHRRFLRYSPWGPVEITTGIVGDNLLNVDIRNSTQFHKDEILLPGRNFKFFLNVKYDAEKPSGPPGYYKARKVHGAPPLVYKAPVPWSGWAWAGLYVGGNAGASFGGSLVETTFREFATDEPLFGSRPSTRPDGAIFGVQAGYNWTADIWLAGIEGDMQHSRQRGSLTDLCTGDVCNAGLAPLDAPVNVALEHKLGWFGTLRGRFGTTVVPQALAYVTAGVAAAGITIGGTVSGFDDAGTRVGTAFDHRLTRFGWTLGVGLEARLIGNWTGKLEYLHMDFGSIPTVVPNGTVSTQFNSRISDDVVRVGVNYKFDRIGAVVAKY